VSYWIYSTPTIMTIAERRARRIDAAVWIMRVALASIFIVVGFVKIPGSIHPMWVRLFERIGFGQWFRYFTALVEIVGGMLMIVPSATLVSGLLLASAMVGALLVHIFVIGVGVQTVFVFALLSGISAVIWHYHNLNDDFCTFALVGELPARNVSGIRRRINSSHVRLYRHISRGTIA
jgi:putative oxidoreductase